MASNVVWWHPELQFAVLEQENGFAIASIYDGTIALEDVLIGGVPREGACQLTNRRTGLPVWLSVEGVGLTEEEVSELLGHLRD
ncbi:MAG: hypothetical protein GAK28_01955 [Luteibacter sp.]|uniref:hypothetical protein n=1 Tax=Luteibacter sp. TaxID=1886636 RepID=UPI00137CDF56|nr:hypothetical protein [Luteibacter sp.]KAF1007316.1 MAG: hypothetical protein GAK28_01955 [Luteibacter sp.]